MAAKLSVCLTTYNRAKLLEDTLQSLRDQTRQPDELIISDDCSPDETPEVVERWRGEFPLLRYHRNAQNLYMPGNLNTVISMASGEYVANLHDGDRFAVDLLEKWEDALDRYPSAGFVFNGWIASRLFLPDVKPLTPGREFYEKHMLHHLSSIVWGTVMARRRAYETLLPFDARYGFVSDVDMWIRMCLQWDVAYVREPLIILDNSPTKERQFSWRKMETMRAMQLENIHRFFSDRPARWRYELLRHRLWVQRMYGLCLLWRAKRRDWSDVREGLWLCRHLDLPLRLFGELARLVPALRL